MKEKNATDNKLTAAITKEFQHHRIVTWYDRQKELRHEYEALEIPDVEKIEIKNNHLGIKYRILRQHPKQKFLLYHEGPPPAEKDNWLLDVQMSNSDFRTDQLSIWLSELQLHREFADALKPHVNFLKTAKRRNALKKHLQPNDTITMIRKKMLAVCVNTKYADDKRYVATILENLLAELAEQKDDKMKLLSQCQLEPFLWEMFKREYGYQSQTPGIKDFALELFKNEYTRGTGGQCKLSTTAMSFMASWKDSISHGSVFVTLSDHCAELLDIVKDLQKQDYMTLVDEDVDTFRQIDNKILEELAQSVTARTIPVEKCSRIVRQRRQRYWCKQYKTVNPEKQYDNLYQTLLYGAQFLRTLDKTDLNISTKNEGIQNYVNHWYKLDQLYRTYIVHMHEAGGNSLLEKLTENVNNLYVNNYLLKVNGNWQQLLDATEKWQPPQTPLQNRFFKEKVQSYLSGDKKVCVIISDGLRYEIGAELLGHIRREDRYEAKLTPALTLLPSYTQLGMAALLPHNTLAISEDKSGTALVDGQSTRGTANRKRIIEKATEGKGTAITAEALLNQTGEESRAMIRKHNVVYVYHNQIDTVGDKRETEANVFKTVEQTLPELVRIIKKLTNANARNLLVTSDHGFIYQDRPIEESDFSGASASGPGVLYKDRRFILGKNLPELPGLKKYNAADTGLSGEIEMLIPKSINRLRKQGSGSRYVHGGSTLQEVVVPVITVNKKRESDLSQVKVEIFRGSVTYITSWQFTVTLYQDGPVTDKVRPRELRAGIYTAEDQLISDHREITCDLTSTDPREREMKVRFLLTREANKANGREVTLRLDEKIPGTNHYREYNHITYTVRLSMESDF